jgi:hypothetical protein
MKEREWVAAMDWVTAEHKVYEGDKFTNEEDDALTTDEWENNVVKYLDRARVLGLDNPLGRQAVGKAATTAIAYLESVFRNHRSVPSPGFPSGEIRGEFKID